MWTKYGLIYKTEKLCKLEDRTIVSYEVAHYTDEEVYDPKLFEFIGTGYVYSIDGALQSLEDEEYLYFYRRIDK